MGINIFCEGKHFLSLIHDTREPAFFYFRCGGVWGNIKSEFVYLCGVKMSDGCSAVLPCTAHLWHFFTRSLATFLQINLMTLAFVAN